VSEPAESPEVLAATITASLRTEQFGRSLHVQAVATSTNDLARELAAAGAPEGTAVLALEQSAGRGRLGRRWASPPGGLYLSVVLRPRIPLERWPLVGLAASLGAAEAVDKHLHPDVQAPGHTVRLKWPNDLQLDGLKVGGILVEVSGDAAICGIGLNIIPPTRSGPSWTSPNRSVDMHGATWLGTRNHAVTVAGLAQDVLYECERRYVALGDDPAAILAEWRVRAVTLGQPVRVEVPGPPIEGVAEDIDVAGALLVRTASGIRRVLAGDVVTHGKGGGAGDDGSRPPGSTVPPAR
jgi:BirA family biotin operon repressor/biotin-[acetyl-CoA-carboxylase] ligase